MFLYFFSYLAGCSFSETKPFPSSETGSTEPLNSDSGSTPELEETNATNDDCVTASGRTENSSEWIDGEERAQLQIANPDDCVRTYTLTSTQFILDGRPENPRVFTENEDTPVSRTGHDLFDALYAMSIVEVGENGVDAVQDDAFNDGEPIVCPVGGCFETGLKWPYVWTRDIAYSSYLSLGLLDPERSRNSLEFKLATRRDGTDLQIVQDTGTGGSHPVSTDRVAWAMGAWETLKFLDGEARTQFLRRSYEAMSHTAEHDRILVWDPVDGLYSGETSFLDWREQSYPEFTASDPAQIAMSKSLSTNLVHLNLLEVTAALANEQNFTAEAQKYESWATDLRGAVDANFWLESMNGYGGHVPSVLDRAPTHRMDLLASSLAVLSGVGSEDRRRAVLSNYPHLTKGPPVIWPQQQFTPIYHNRGIWPFVTAFWIKAAKSERHAGVVTQGVYSLMRAAVMNLSNMENLEAATGLPYKGDEGEYSGPVVNSQRQLWSVAGYASMVQSVIFGFEATQQGIIVDPFIPNRLRQELFQGSHRIALSRLPYKGGRLTIVLNLGPLVDNSTGALVVDTVLLNGESVSTGEIPSDQLTGEDTVEVEMVYAIDVLNEVTIVDDDDLQNYENLYGPRTPAITDIMSGSNGLNLSLSVHPDEMVTSTLDLYRDGILVAENLPGTAQLWIDTEVAGDVSTTHCYSVQSRFQSGNHSQRGKAFCWWGENNDNVHTYDAQSFEASGGALVFNHGEWHYEGWGSTNDYLKVQGFTPEKSGEHLVQLRYGNGSGPINTGISCGVKRISVYEGWQLVGRGYVTLPQLGDWSTWSDSTFVPFYLEAGRSYDVLIDEDRHAINMSHSGHFSGYSGSGGWNGPVNFINVAAIKLLRY